MEISENLILIVEDDIGLAELISEQISDLGYDCKVFTKARDAIQWLQNTLPLLILLDYGLPDLTGKEFINELRESGKSIPPFVVATGRGDERIAVEMMKLGARDYIVKDSQFINLIQHIIQRVTNEVKTERKLLKAERELNELNRFNAQIIESAKEGLIVYDKKLNYIVFNKFIEELSGKKASEIIGKNVLDIFPFIKSSGVYDALQQALKGKESEIELLFEVPDTGKSGWVLVSFSSLRNADNDIIGAISIIHDITERKQSELAIQTNRELLQKLLFRSSDFIGNDAAIDFQSILGTMIEISGAKYGAFNLFEGNESEFQTVALKADNYEIEKVSNLLGFNIYKKRWKHEPIRSAKINGNQITRFESLSKLTGKVIIEKIVLLIEKTFDIGAVYIVKVDTNKKSLGDFTLIYNRNEELQNREIVELFANQIALYIQRNQSELDIKENENKFRLLFNENPQPMCVYDLETLKFVEINQAAIEHYGYSREEFLNMSIDDIRPPEDIPALMKDIEETGLSLYSTGEWRHCKKTGQIIDVKITSRRVKLNGRESRHVLIQDITEQKIAEKELKDKMEELMRFHNLTIDRELTMIELKKEINRLLKETGKPVKYNIVS